MTAARQATLRALAGAACGTPIVTLDALSGGTFGSTWRGSTADGSVFVKTTPAAQSDWLAAEADGVSALARCDALSVPPLLGYAADSQHAALVLGWLDLRRASDADDARMGAALAALHAHRGERFGWSRDNYLGATRQRNDWRDTAAAFFVACRLRPQLELATANGFAAEVAEQGSRLCDAVPALYGGHPRPALVHGDLWSGNRGVAGDGRPALFDPAVHFGDPQNDIAMSELFGGFGARFYAAYAAASDDRSGNLAARRALHRLYHLLNHLNLFGRGYLAQVQSTMHELLADA